MDGTAGLTEDGRGCQVPAAARAAILAADDTICYVPASMTRTARGLRSLWIETGSAPAFQPALRLYESAGFRRCGPFGDYREDPFSVFMTRELSSP